MRVFLLFASFALAAVPLCADHQMPAGDRPAVLLDGLGDLHHPVATKNPEAQRFFDQGLRLIYAFNHDEALRSFRRAAELDPNLAMAHWGMALAVGPNYNLDAEEAALKAAYAAIQEALTLAKEAPPQERDYIEALAKRYAADPAKADKKKQALAYKEAMAALAKKYPDDLDAATLYAESAMNLRPWELWTPDGKPAEGTEEIVAVLESVLRRNPNHTGANHYYIHAVEASPWPERGLGAAVRLEHLAPGAGHLVHMPSHIHSRVGDYAEAARINEKAAAVDRAYVARFNLQGVYPLMYYDHNMHFAAVAHHMQGNFADSKMWADRLAAFAGPYFAAMPMVEFFLPTPTLVLVRFARWDDVLKLPEPDEKQTIVRALRHYARGAAFCAKGDAAAAAEELAALRKLHEAMPDDLAFGDRNKAKKVIEVPAALLAGRLALVKQDRSGGLEWLRKAVAAEDALNYIEPADWHLPTRETLGAALLKQGDAAAAEMTFRADLDRNRRNPRSLFGLMACLKAQGKDHAAKLVQQEFDAAWKNADVQLKLEDY